MKSLEFTPEAEGDVRVFYIELQQYYFGDGFGHHSNSGRDESSLNQDNTE